MFLPNPNVDVRDRGITYATNEWGMSTFAGEILGKRYHDIKRSVLIDAVHGKFATVIDAKLEDRAAHWC